MALSSFAFLFAGVLCNAAAQLLLKAGVSTVGAIPLERAALLNARLAGTDPMASSGGPRVIWDRRGGLDCGSVAHRRVGGLPHVVGRLCAQCCGCLLATW